MAGDEGSVEVAVVLPLSREPALFVETVASVLRQVSPPGFRIVAVLHGMAYRQSEEAATALARAHAPRLALLRQASGGVAAARNAGLRFARAAWPALRAFALLDEGDRLGPHALRRAWEALAAAPGAGWVYGDADNVGQRAGRSAAGAHSPLQHLTEQACEATLLLLRDLFDAGLAFHDALPPDAAWWDLHLAAIARGAGGVFLPEAGLFRRRRPEAAAPPMPPRHPALFAPPRSWRARPRKPRVCCSPGPRRAPSAWIPTPPPRRCRAMPRWRGSPPGSQAQVCNTPRRCWPSGRPPPSPRCAAPGCSAA